MSIWQKENLKLPITYRREVIMMKWEKPMLEIRMFDEADIVRTSVGDNEGDAQKDWLSFE